MPTQAATCHPDCGRIVRRIDGQHAHSNHDGICWHENEATCRHCGRNIVREGEGLYVWIDPEATGDDSIWRESCDRNDTFTAEHEPAD